MPAYQISPDAPYQGKKNKRRGREEKKGGGGGGEQKESTVSIVLALSSVGKIVQLYNIIVMETSMTCVTLN